MFNSVNTVLPYIVLGSHFVFIFLLLSLIFRNSWGQEIVRWLGRNALLLAFITGLVALCGSLFYSEIIGYEPCVLCWWQRIFLYPTAIIFGIGLWTRNRSAFLFATPMALLAGVIALYHSYVYMGGSSILPCTALGGACSKIYVMAFGYITIPMMSLTIVAYILLLAWASRIYKNENSNA